MNVELVTIGDELLLGQTVDGNAAWIARELAAIGVPIARRTSVGDQAQAIAECVREALERTGAVITTGGLGPTADDLTKPAIAALFGRGLHFDESLWENLRRLWRERGRSGEPPPSNRQQVMIPDGAVVLVNRHGTAPGVFLEDSGGKWVAMLPGVPREMRGLLADELVPRIRSRMTGEEHVVRSQTIRTTGIAESQLPALLGDCAASVDGMPLAYLPGLEGVDLRLTVRDVVPAVADRQLGAAASKLVQRLGRYHYGFGTEDLADVVLGQCRSRALTIATAESCTGGLLGARLTSIPGSSDVFTGGVIAYSNQVKERLLSVRSGSLEQFGAVSEAVALEMARGVRSALGSAIGMGITGVAGPSGGTESKPVGLVWTAVDFGRTERTERRVFFGDRVEVRFRAVQAALDIVRRELAEEMPGSR